LAEQIEALRAEHLGLLREVEHRYHDSSDLDSRFPRLINSAGRMTADITFRRNWRKLLSSKARLS
jgi:hypothetical protein